MTAAHATAKPAAPRSRAGAEADASLRLDAVSFARRAPTEPDTARAAWSERDTARSAHAAVLLLADIAPRARLWGWSRVVRGAAALRRVPGLRFAKVMGSGHDGGFGLRPSVSLQGLFAVFDSDDAAAAFIAQAPLVHAYRDRARELLWLRLAPYACRGAWNGHTLQPAVDAPADGPIAALTRASIRPLAAASFWRHAPSSQAGLSNATGCRLAVGLGEAPLLRQCTFSVWDSTAAMDAYARSGAHLAAIRASVQLGFFSESMFVRFVVRAMQGTWKGQRHALG